LLDLGNLYAFFSGGKPVMRNSISLRMRLGEREGIVQEIASWTAELAEEMESEAWKNDYDLAQLALDVQDAIREVIDDAASDEQYIERVVSSLHGQPKEHLDEANRFFQKYLNTSIRIHTLLRACVRLMSKCDYHVENAEALNSLTEKYRGWKDELPDRLAMLYQPVQQTIRDRIAKALSSSPQESNWQELFAGEDD
jgi:hypothetical protein